MTDKIEYSVWQLLENNERLIKEIERLKLEIKELEFQNKLLKERLKNAGWK